MNQPMPPMPPRIARLPRDHRGFPIPWFVADVGAGVRDFRVADGRKRHDAIKRKLCWVCGEQLGRFQAFVIGPMCVVNRVTAEPPCHLECAEFSAAACPFLSRPRMRRNDKDLPQEAADGPGISIPRNPGVTCIYIAKTYHLFRDGKGGVLIRLQEPSEVKWYAEGKPGASREQVWASIESGYPLLLKMAEQDGPDAIAMLQNQRDRAMVLLPAA